MLSLPHRCSYTFVSMMLYHFLTIRSICQILLANFPVTFLCVDAVHLVNWDTE